VAFQPSAFAFGFQTGSPAPPTPADVLADALPGHTSADVLALAQLLAANQADVLTLIDYYDDAMADLAKIDMFIETRLLPLTADQASVEPPEPTVHVVAVCYDDRDLAETSMLDLEMLSPQWRDRTGTPYAYTQEDETTMTFRMIPVPMVPSKAFSFLHGEPLGVDFPAYVAAVFLSEQRADVPRWLDLPLAFSLLVREFGRDSDHMDPAFAAACRTFGQLLLGTVLVDAA
jgi:hypothetical protein